jgi:prolyl oligopeptidase
MASMLLVLAGCVSGLRLDPEHYPPAARGATVDDYHGTRVADPIAGWKRRIRRRHSSSLRQNALTRPYLDALPSLPAIRARLGLLYRYERFGVPTGPRPLFLPAQ